MSCRCEHALRSISNDYQTAGLECQGRCFSPCRCLLLQAAKVSVCLRHCCGCGAVQAFDKKEREGINVAIQEGIDIICAVLTLGMEKAVSGNRVPR